MNLKRQRFAEAFVGEARGNATKAAELAGYSANTARQIGSRLLTYVDVQAAVQQHQESLVAKSTFTPERILQELETVAQAKVDVKSTDKMKALELLGKHRKMWDDKTQQDSRITVNIGYLSTTREPLTIDITATPEPPKP